MEIKKQFISSIVNTLKIDNNPFNTGLISDLLTNVKESEYREFYNLLFGEEKMYLNGLDRVKEVSKVFDKKRSDEQYSLERRIDTIYYVITDAIYKKITDISKIRWKMKEDEDYQQFTDKEIEFLSNYDLIEITSSMHDFINLAKKELGFRKDLVIVSNKWS